MGNAPLELLVPISAGELLDKITILRIKEDRLRSEEKRANVRRELSLLEQIANVHLSRATLANHEADLLRVNETLWTIEEELRAHEAQGTFDTEFIRLARSVYVTNDERARIKRAINEVVGSALVEEKSYGEDSR